MIVELDGLEVFGRHGVEDDERRDGRTFLYDIALEVSDAREFRLIEALAAAVADALAERFPVKRVRVRVRKPDPKPAGLTVAYSAATVERP